ncbi:MAG: 50S ribosomal protein L6 [Planctomycetota bacterium]
MSRIGRKPVEMGEKVKASVSARVLEVSGPLGKLTLPVPDPIRVEVDDGARRITVHRLDDEKRNRALHGLVRALAANMVLGVSKGFTKKLEIVGVGYNAKVQGKKLAVNVGFSHAVEMPVPEGLKVECPSPTEIIITGADKQLVGQFACEVRAVRPPEPYKGKGIRYAGETVRRKQGKAFVSGPA